MAELAFRLWYEEEGQGMVEYALIFILVLLLAIISMKNLAAKADSIYASAASSIRGGHTPAQPNNDGVQGASGVSWSQSGADSSNSIQNNPANNLPRSGVR